MHLERLRKLTTELLSRLPLPALRRDPPMTWTKRVARLAARKAQVELIAKEIIEYRVMMGIQGDVLIGVLEVSTRFTESPDDVREAFRLLQAQGIAERSRFKDHWVLTQLELGSLC